MQSADNAAQGDDLGMLAGEPVNTVEVTTYGGEVVSVPLREMSFAQLAKLVSVAAPGLAEAAMMAELAPDLPNQMLAALLRNATATPELLSIACGLDAGLVGSLPGSEALRLAAAVVETQRPFFADPAVKSAVAALLQTLAGVKAG